MSTHTVTVPALTRTVTFDLTLPDDRPVTQDMARMFMHGALYEPGLTRFLATVLRPGDLAVDAGAHVGYVTTLMAHLVGPSGAVLSVEPMASNREWLARNVAALPQVEVVPAALGDTVGTVTLYENADNDGGHACWDPALHPANVKSQRSHVPLTVPMTTLDVLLAGRPTPRVLKCDIEGSEVAALAGAAALMDRDPRIPFVICEINRSALAWMGTSENHLRLWMAARGYECWHLADEEPALREMQPDETVNGHVVFNVLFRQPGVSLT